MKTALTTTIVRAVFGLLTAACGNDDSTPTTPTTTGPSTEVFSGTLAVRGSSFYSFTVATSGQVSITLALGVSDGRTAPGSGETSLDAHHKSATDKAQ